MKVWASAVRGRKVSQLLGEIKRTLDLEELERRFTPKCQDNMQPSGSSISMKLVRRASREN
jgi:hypothetical protein